MKASLSDNCRRAILRANLGALALSTVLHARPAATDPIVMERAVVRLVAPETGGPRSPRFILERTLAFEARLEAMADESHPLEPRIPYRERHVRAALERHVAETLLANLRIEPDPTVSELDRLTEAARLMLVERVGGPNALRQATRAEGIGQQELLGIIRRRARATLYLDRMVTPMLSPSNATLRAAHRTAPRPLRDRAFADVSAELRRWYVAERLVAALNTFYENASVRVELTVIDWQLTDPATPEPSAKAAAQATGD
ncbi:hypothetical protein ACFL5O_00270 [Myxococcota bacterium]